jgi:hypothetical protein
MCCSDIMEWKSGVLVFWCKMVGWAVCDGPSSYFPSSPRWKNRMVISGKEKVSLRFVSYIYAFPVFSVSSTLHRNPLPSLRRRGVGAWIWFICLSQPVLSKIAFANQKSTFKVLNVYIILLHCKSFDLYLIMAYCKASNVYLILLHCRVFNVNLLSNFLYTIWTSWQRSKLTRTLTFSTSPSVFGYAWLFYI